MQNSNYQIFSFIFILVFAAICNSSCSYKKIYDSPQVTKLPVLDYVQKIKEAEHFIIIDVRTPPEYQTSHYPSAVNINLLKHFKKDIANLDTTKTVFLYCETAHRSPYAIQFLKKGGFTKIYDLEKGYSQIKLLTFKNKNL
jgi:rhodanese-related sulfurtransferase